MLDAKSIEAAEIRHRERLRVAWECIVIGLHEIALENDVRALPGAQRFVCMLTAMCADIGAHLSHDSFDEAMKKLEAGFGRAKKLSQDAIYVEMRTFVLQRWEAEKGHHRSKANFARYILPVVLQAYPAVRPTERTIWEKWLKGK